MTFIACDVRRGKTSSDVSLVRTNSARGRCCVTAQVAWRRGICAAVTRCAILRASWILMTLSARYADGAPRIIGPVARLAVSHVPVLFSDCLTVKVRGGDRCPSCRVDADGRYGGRGQIIAQIAACAEEEEDQRRYQEYVPGMCRESFHVSGTVIISSVTVAAEPAPSVAIRVSVGIVVTRVAGGTGIRMPLTVYSSHESERMRFRIGPSNAIRINVTGGTDGIGSLGIVARRAALYITLCHLCMLPSAAANADRHESRSFV